MKKRFRLFYYNNKSWILNLQYIFLSIILVIFVYLVDYRILPIIDYFPELFTTSISLSQTILVTLAGAQLTVTTFSFATILSVLTFYGSNYTPRALENFIKQKYAMKVLGIFVGGFFYSVMGILFMQNTLQDGPVISGFVGILYAIFGIIYFIIFVQGVLYSIQDVNIIGSIYNETYPMVLKECKSRQLTLEYTQKTGSVVTKIYAHESGYLASINTKKLSSLLKDYEGLFTIHKKIGEYVVQGVLIASAEFVEHEVDDDKKEKIKKCFLIQDDKVPLDDYRYGMTKITEIAVRALSPGINDPNTAIHCIRKLSLLLGILASVDEYHVIATKEKECDIFYTSYPIEEDLSNIMYPIIEYGQKDLLVVRALLEEMYVIYQKADEENHKEIIDFCDYIIEKTRPNFTLNNEKKQIQDLYDLTAAEFKKELVNRKKQEEYDAKDEQKREEKERQKRSKHQMKRES